MKFSSKNVIPSNKCIEHRCKTCPERLECDLKYKAEPLTYRPFENLKEILDERDKMHQHNIHI